jgi:transposase
MIDVAGRIFVYANYVDMRKSINGLSILVHVSGQAFDGGGVYVFLNKARDKIKILVKENNGFVLLYKRLDAGNFKLSLLSKTEIVLTSQQLRWLLDGLDYAQLIPVKSLKIKHLF